MTKPAAVRAAEAALLDRQLTVAGAIWCVAFGLSAFWADEITDALFVLALLYWLVLYALGVTLLILAAIRAVKAGPGRRRGPALSILLPVCLWLATDLTGRGWVRAARWQTQRRTYEAAVARVLAAPPASRKAACGPNCNVDDGPPVRVAFVQPGGILDNYVAVVYDPTGLVMQAKKFKPDWSNWNDPKLAKVKKLFGGDLRWARHITGPWYRCGFT